MMGKNKKRREVLSLSGGSAFILPEKFLEMLVDAAGEDRAKIVSDAILTTPAELSVRLNPTKLPNDLEYDFETDKRVPWCKDGCYLSQRPDFTLDPLLHAGAYYVQEPSSISTPKQFLTYVLPPGEKARILHRLCLHLHFCTLMR